MREELEENNVNLTLEEIMYLTEEDLNEMETTREELIELLKIDQQQYDELSGSSHNDQFNEEEEFTSDQEIEIEVDDSGLESLEMEAIVEVKIEDLPFFNEIYLENMMNWSWDEHLNPTPPSKKKDETISTITLPAGLSKKSRLKREKKLQQNGTVKSSPPRPFHHPISFWESYREIICSKFARCNPIQEIDCIVKEDLLERFKKAIVEEENRLGKSVSNRIAMCFHGTHPNNIQGIIENGLLVPGKNNNLVVVNGSAFGVGVYVTVMDPSVSVGYCKGGNQLFACAVLLSDTVNTKNHGNVLVIMEEKFILPCFLLTIKQTNNDQLYTPQPLSIEEEKKNLTKKGELVFSKKRKEEEREKIRKKKVEKATKQK